MSHIQLKLCFSVVLKHFLGNSQRTSLFIPNMTILERSTEKPRKFVFLYVFEKGHILRKIWICLNNCLWSTIKRWQIKKKIVFRLKVNNIQLKYAFQLFWSILGEIHRELLFLVQKVTISEKSTEILRKFVFLNKFEKGKSRGKFGFV